MPSHLVLGLWPIAGVTTIGVTRSDAEDTIAAAITSGIHRFDTAYSYGYEGESDRLIGSFIRSERDRFELIGKVGQRWSHDRRRVVDGKPKSLIADAEDSLSRAGLEHFDTLMLHQPDPEVPLAESVGALEQIRHRGLARELGLCNATPSQRAEFSAVARCAAIQCPLNLLQPDSLVTTIADANDAGAAAHVYWTLMKGLLAGKIGREHHFQPGDSRPSYPIFQGAARERAHRVVDDLNELGNNLGKTVAQLAVGWAASQSGVDAAIVGARRPEQIEEIAGTTLLPDDVLRRMEEIAVQGRMA